MWQTIILKGTKVTLMNEYKPLKLDNQVEAAQGTVFAPKGSLNSLTDMVAHERPLFYELRWRVLTCRIFIRSQS
jgi:hypothetical protein